MRTLLRPQGAQKARVGPTTKATAKEETAKATAKGNESQTQGSAQQNEN